MGADLRKDAHEVKMLSKAVTSALEAVEAQGTSLASTTRKLEASAAAAIDASEGRARELEAQLDSNLRELQSCRLALAEAE
eukprot:CAMPEP_0197853684 /NCGR_PEP_ID=MMETSP1438-20131217/23184_1 /TAXON_ID=1461541 /ORGANISM="Pterosperma sp., Strain CCMP1384" /LENGTH=80 /DNA_ID=CAMNT_0043468171 /DNA_START=33 /DNA_END=272 /DNA_ORIENTATION=+